ncbi:MAG TPA: PH domain-containing protein [Mycobacteriales bacterium]|nr:PH domain-containing protein [Mycobacteriales bacterium]
MRLGPGDVLITNRAQTYGVFSATGLLAAAFALGAAVRGAHSDPTYGDQVGDGLVAVAFAAAALRSLRLGVEVGPRTVTIRNIGSTKVFSWESVRDLTIVDSGNVTGRATCVALILNSGEVVRAMPTGSYRPSKVRAMLEQIQEARPAPSPA